MVIKDYYSLSEASDILGKKKKLSDDGIEMEN